MVVEWLGCVAGGTFGSLPGSQSNDPYVDKYWINHTSFKRICIEETHIMRFNSRTRDEASVLILLSIPVVSSKYRKRK